VTIQETFPEVVPDVIFNTKKSDYTQTSLFLGEKPGLFDTVNKQYPKVWKLYKGMKSLDWDENEFNYSSCNVEFKTLPRAKSQKMIKSLAYQWEADSVASRSISHIVSLYDPCPELWAAWQQVSTNEVVHGATYSEIVRTSFDDPRSVLTDILAITEAMQRLSTIANELKWIRERGLLYALGMVPNDQETYNAIFMFAFVMLVLERLQFMASFAVTFALGEENCFMPIAKAVQKIAQDEYEIHVDLDREVLGNELQTERGQIAYQQMKSRMERVLNDVIRAELTFSGYIFEDDTGPEDELKYLNQQQLDRWVLFSATNIARPLRLEMDFPQVEENPLHYMKSWMDISDTQPSPQEEANGQYKVNIMRRDDEEVDFDDEF
jgi:ribonucleoside-diphosphate reductase beta chain